MKADLAVKAVADQLPSLVAVSSLSAFAVSLALLSLSRLQKEA